MSLLARISKEPIKPNKVTATPSIKTNNKKVVAELSLVLTSEMRAIAAEAIQLPVASYPCIKPIRGTLAFHIYSMERTNDEIALCLKLTIDQKSANMPKLERLIAKWDKLDEASKARHDVFDYLCAEFKINIIDFMSWLVAGSMLLGDKEVEQILAIGKIPLLRKINEMAQVDGGIRDRELLANIHGLVQKPAPLVAINNTTTNNTVNMGVPKFTKRARAIEEALVKPRELGPATEDFIEAEIIEAEECIPIPIKN